MIDGPSQKEQIIKVMSKFLDKIEINWAVHPTLKGEFGIITKKGISKNKGLRDIQEYLSLESPNLLGAGDTIGDWDFLKDCKYKATLENATEELKKKFKKENKEFAFISKSVDENGILEIFDYFGI